MGAGWLPGGGAGVGGGCRVAVDDRRVTSPEADAATEGRRVALRRGGLPAAVAVGRRVGRALLAAAARVALRAVRLPSVSEVPPAAVWAERSRLASASSAAFSRPGHRQRRRLGCRSGLSSGSSSSSLSSM